MISSYMSLTKLPKFKVGIIKYSECVKNVWTCALIVPSCINKLKGWIHKYYSDQDKSDHKDTITRVVMDSLTSVM